MALAVEKDHYESQIFVEEGVQYQLSVRESFKDTIENHEEVIEYRITNVVPPEYDYHFIAYTREQIIAIK